MLCVLLSKHAGIRKSRQLWLIFPLCVRSQPFETKVHLLRILFCSSDVKGRASAICLKETDFWLLPGLGIRNASKTRLRTENIFHLFQTWVFRNI